MTEKVESSAALRRILEEGLGADRIHRIAVTPYIDHAGEPAYSIAVSMKSAKDIPVSRRQTELTHELREALGKLGDPRFPYLYFDALDIERSDDEADDFEPLADD